MIAKVILVATLVAVSFALPYRPRPVEEPAAQEPAAQEPAAQEPAAKEAVVEEKFEPIPYEFGYETNDDKGTTTFRKETSDGKGNVQGSYGYKDLHGIERIVEYVADEHGYRAQIKTNEPGTDSQNPADVVLDAKPIVIEEPKYEAPARQEYSAPEPHYYHVPEQPYHPYYY